MPALKSPVTSSASSPCSSRSARARSARERISASAKCRVTRTCGYSAAVSARTFHVAGAAPAASLSTLVDGLAAALEHIGFVRGDDDPDLVLNVGNADAPRPFRRHSRGTFVAALHVSES